MRVISLELGPFAAHCVVVAGETSADALVIDPGFDVEQVIDTVHKERLEPRAIVLTHAHVDHAYGVAEVREAFPGARVLMHELEVPLYRNLPMQAEMFGFPAPATVEDIELVGDGDRIACGSDALLVRHAPGHSPGHIVLVHDHPRTPLAIVGDVLFAGSIGRTDLWGGSYPVLERSIREVLYRLPGATRVVCGHGPDTTIGEEMATNPFVRGT